MRFLEEKKIGYATGVARVPIVPAAAIFDLAVGSAQYGLGFSQTTTKTTDWVHASFGGFW